jgi:hypothetical protein
MLLGELIQQVFEVHAVGDVPALSQDIDHFLPPTHFLVAASPARACSMAGAPSATGRRRADCSSRSPANLVSRFAVRDRGRNELRVRSETRFRVLGEVLALARCDRHASPDLPSAIIGTVTTVVISVAQAGAVAGSSRSAV